MRPWRWGLVAVACLVAGCGQKADVAAGGAIPDPALGEVSAAPAPPPAKTVSGAADAAASQAPTTAMTTAAPTRKAPAPTAKQAAPAPASVTTTTSPKQGLNDIVKIDAPACVVAGSVLTATIKGPPDAVVAMALRFADGGNYDVYKTGEADGTGTFVARLTIPPGVPAGPANIYAAANSETGGGAADRPIRVVKGGSC